MTCGSFFGRHCAPVVIGLLFPRVHEYGININTALTQLNSFNVAITSLFRWQDDVLDLQTRRDVEAQTYGHKRFVPATIPALQLLLASDV